MRECSGYDTAEAVAYAMRQLEAETSRLPQLDARILRLLAALQYATARLGRLRVLDFGGSLGAVYFLLRDFLDFESWTVCDLPQMVRAGNQRCASSILRFVESVEGESSPNVVLASGVLQCCRDPRESLSQLASLGASYLIVDRLPMLPAERLTVHKVPPQVFAGSFPAWFFGPDFLDSLSRWRVVMQWEMPEHLAHLDGISQPAYHGFFFERR